METQVMERLPGLPGLPGFALSHKGMRLIGGRYPFYRPG